MPYIYIQQWSDTKKARLQMSIPNARKLLESTNTLNMWYFWYSVTSVQQLKCASEDNLLHSAHRFRTMKPQEMITQTGTALQHRQQSLLVLAQWYAKHNGSQSYHLQFYDLNQFYPASFHLFLTKPDNCCISKKPGMPTTDHHTPWLDRD